MALPTDKLSMRSNSTLSSLALDVLFDSLESDDVPPSDTTTSTDMWSRHNLSTVEEITAYHQVMLNLMLTLEQASH
mgnify:FL=1